MGREGAKPDAGPVGDKVNLGLGYIGKHLHDLTTNFRKKINEKRLEQVRYQLMLKHLEDSRVDQLRRLKDWEREINQLEKVKITVENNVDLEGPPRHMQYVTDNVPSEGIVIPDDPPIGCECEGGCSLKNEESW